MHELSLISQVSAARHEQVLQILAGLAGMQPQRIIERRQIYKPRRSPGARPTQVGGSQGIQSQQSQVLQGQLQGELFYLQLAREVDVGAFTQPHNPGSESHSTEDRAMRNADMTDVGHVDKSNGIPSVTTRGAATSSAEKSEHPRSLRFYDLPEVPGKRPVTSRMVSAVDLIEGDAPQFMEDFGYNYVAEHILEGQRVIYNNIVLFLHRILRLPQSPPSQNTGTSQGSMQASSSGPYQQLPPFQSLVPLDTSGAYLLQASVRVLDGSKPESMILGINELKGLREMLKGVVELDVSDRLALDTRVK